MSNSSLSLYKIASEYQGLFHRLYDHETGEINMEIQAQIDALGDTAEKKCVAVAHWIKKIEADKREIEYFKAELAEREAAFNKEIDRWYDYLKSNMERCEITEIKSPFFKLRIKKNPYSTDIMDESALPDKFINTKTVTKVETKPDKNAIKEEVLRTGVQVPGALVQQKTKLEIIINKI